MMGASRHNEGKLHLGYVYAADTSLETHKILAEGTLRFLDTLERLTGCPRDRFTVSDAFTYVVPDDSARTPDDIWAYFNSVDDTVAELCDQMGLSPYERARVATKEYYRTHYGDCVQTAYHTPEIAVDPGRVSDIVAAAVYAHPLITFLGARTVMDVRRVGASGYRIRLSDQTEITQLDAAAVINALWEDRLRIDEMVGLGSPFVWSQRWKATVTIEVPPESITLPSTTALVGPYGDFVLYGKARVYISWYPACRLSMSTTASPDQVRAIVDAANHDDIRVRSLRNLSRLIPGVSDLLAYKNNTTVGGGFIMAVGESDIDDRKSGLHERHQIGVEHHDTWVSLSTGKFCTAPMFAVRAARGLKGVLT
ncbi:hypothetical protein C7455_11221 [Roseicyclus mahoneyensis]|uniref:FAD dependent oxidoreductase n=2 Tax=Roseicyclus mahoneyensis TaxID=164332 RepID=A0A316GBA5_9RHOB|nr:hypothetical protein C7455_11221 [Roseicyclus mahoneyensis]